MQLRMRLSAYKKAFQEEPWLKGMLVIVGWDSLEPAQGRFDWSEVDKQVVLAARYNRKVSLLFVSMLAPDWVYRQGVRKYTFADPNPFHQGHYGKG
jgi:Beta-galactosidase